MNFGELFHIQPENIMEQPREIENIKNYTARVVIRFNETCINVY